MLTNDLFNTDYERRLAEGAVDQLEQRRIDDLAMKMDDLVARAKDPEYKKNPAALSALMKEFQKCKAERDSYYKLREAGIGQDIVNKQEKMARATPATPTGAVASTVKNAAKWLAGQGGPGKEGPTYEGTEGQWSKEGSWTKIPKNKAGQPVDPRGEVAHLSDVARREAERKAAQDQKKNPKEVAEHGGGIGPKQRWQDLMQERKLSVGDAVIVTAPNEFEGKTGEIAEFSPSGKFVVVNLYNHGEHSMHLSDVEYNQYADDENNDDWYDEGVAETVTDPRAGMAEIYRRLSPKIERYKDSFLAGQLYDELENYAELHGAETEFKRMMNGARNRAHMEYDTNPGGFQNWFWFLPFEDENVSEGWSERALAQRTGQPQTRYAVYIDGRQWKEFATDDQARAVARKLEAKFKADGSNKKVSFSPATSATNKSVKEEKTRLDKTHNNLTESKTYKLWESAGCKIVEAQLTTAQIQQIFQQAEQGVTATGANRTGLGQVKDAGSAVAQAWAQLKTKVANSGPVKNIDAYYDQAAEKLRQATGGDQGVMQYVEKYRTFAKAHPVAQSLIYSALIAAAGISGAGAGGAAALGLFKLVDKLLQGEKFSTAVGQGVTTGALAYGASQLADLFKGGDAVAGVGQTRGLSDEQIAALKQYGAEGNKMLVRNNSLWIDGVNGPTMLSPPLGSSAEQMLKIARSGVTPATESTQVNLLSLKESQIKKMFVLAETMQSRIDEGVWDSIKGAAGKVGSAIAGKARAVGRDLTTRVTANKLAQAWKQAGSPTDSNAVANVMRKAGVDEKIVNSILATVTTPTGNTGALGQMANQLTTPKSSTGGTISKSGVGTVHRASATNPNQPTSIAEEQDTSGVESAIIRRIMVAHVDWLQRFGPEKVMQAAEEVAYNVGDVDEIGTSDVSAYVHEVGQILGVDQLNEKWSQKYKSSINCASPKGFSQRAHCAGRKK